MTERQTYKKCLGVFLIVGSMEDKKKSKSKYNSKDIPSNFNCIKDKAVQREIFQEVKEGNLQHKQIQQAYKNIEGHNLRDLDKTDPEKAKAIRRKGWEAMQAVKGERKTAKQSLEQFLPLFATDTTSDENIPEDVKKLLDKNKQVKITQYDLIMLSMINQARNGNVKAAEYIRDTYGDKPINETHNINETISASDKALIDKISDRLGINKIE